jgi:hypothetical protein
MCAMAKRKSSATPTASGRQQPPRQGQGATPRAASGTAGEAAVERAAGARAAGPGSGPAGACVAGWRRATRCSLIHAIYEFA